ncbi:TetR/AcrR family transcriptional regulator [Phenylobacterium sp. 20VBR1]|uniref:TetR/AcrR family transcriptional regulator n=1 Tax=Phenylobacterium glaciei TaxID=2803784 RepID=A0A941HY08_9CAUL|nr:TetR/AcrR family transcriptional regulator [Phenylobacterium glaciei]MBR7620955.1 TetR/AcrR family transcriptional regulator [Phenylobacterium glaciei]
MRYSEDHKAETRDRVVKAAANAMRRLGPDRVSVAEIMSEVGLTHGGFYAHFKSKDALVGAAVEAAFAQSRWRLGKLALNDDPQILLAGLVDFYVSADHRDHPERGCPIALLSSDIPRQGLPAREAFDAGVHGLIEVIATRLPGGEERLGLAGSLLAEMAGAVALSRAVSDPELSDRLLAESRRRIKARMGLTPSSPEQGLSQ